MTNAWHVIQPLDDDHDPDQCPNSPTGEHDHVEVSPGQLECELCLDSRSAEHNDN